MRIEFPLSYKRTVLGDISDPKIPVTIQRLDGPWSYQFLVDAGADFSLAPLRIANDVGLDISRLPQTRIFGFEQGGVRAYVGRVAMRIRSIDFSVQCFLLEGTGAPFVLSRVDFLDRFVLTVDPPRRTLILETVDV